MKKIISLVITIIYSCAFISNAIYAATDSANDIGQELLDIGVYSEKDYERVRINKSELSEYYREKSKECLAISVSHSDYKKMNKEDIQEILSDGATIAINSDNEDELNNLAFDANKNNKYGVKCEVEDGKVTTVCFSQYRGSVLTSFMGEISTNAYNDKGCIEQSYKDKILKEHITMMMQDYHYNMKELAQLAECDVLESEIVPQDFEFQTINLDTFIEPARASVEVFRDNGVKMGTAVIKTYVYAGKKIGKNAYWFVMSQIEALPNEYYFINDFIGRMETYSSYSSIFDYSYIDDGEAQVSYQLGIGVTGESSGLATITYNGSITNTYSTSAMNVTESFGNVNEGYVEWKVKPLKRLYGQARKIEPAIITKVEGYLAHGVGIKTSIKDAEFAQAGAFYYYDQQVDASLYVYFNIK